MPVDGRLVARVGVLCCVLYNGTSREKKHQHTALNGIFCWVLFGVVFFFSIMYTGQVLVWVLGVGYMGQCWCNVGAVVWGVGVGNE